MPTVDFERDDALDGLSSEELEAQAFGPDPNQKAERRWAVRRQRRVPAVARAPAPPAATFCFACGAETGAARDCSECGVRQPRAARRRGRVVRRGDRRADPSKPTATLLAFALGGVGAHRFYLGQWKTGLAMLLFWWTLVPTVVGFVDFVRYVLLTDREFADRYGDPGLGAALPPSRPALRAADEVGPEGGAEDPVVRVLR